MNINHLRYFQEVCRQGSITKASEACHISQPSITAAINGLETEFDCKLFSRVNNRLKLTNKGKIFQSLTNQFLRDFANYYEKASDLTKGKDTILRVGVPSIMGIFFFQKLLPEFYQKYPDIGLKISEIATIDGVQMLSNAQIDLLLGITDGTCYNNCNSEKLFSTALQLAIKKDHPMAAKKKITPKMLASLPLVIMSKGSYHYKSILSTFNDINLNIIMHSSQLSTIQYMICNHDCATIIYEDIFADDPNICYIPLERPIPAHIHVFWQKNSYLSSAIKSFITYITQLDF